MVLWRLSGAQHAKAFDGGFGLLYDGRWNTAGHAVTYCATSPSLCVLEKLVHIEDPDLLPALEMVRYDVPDGLGVETVSLAELPPTWRFEESLTQQRGDRWQGALRTPLLRVPSAIVSLEGAPDVNMLINHRHPAAASITMIAAEAFVLDTRLFLPGE
ncbi:MAG TPA: RES family NAD+ phosphorylase [Rhizomicrobium sp.]|jgi:RES domain-containing protein|nr:RES family NAD+ phosphorylase [Rhizomicrobium sp.]